MEEKVISDDEAFEPIQKKKMSKKTIIGIIIAIAVVIVVILAIFGILSIKNMIEDNSAQKIGTSAGNTNNCGYFVEDNKYMYYVGPDAELDKTNIYRVNLATNEKEEILKDQYDIRYLNLMKNKLYYVTLNTGSSEYDYDIKICRMNTDGSDQEVINDNLLTDSYLPIYVTNNKVYYIFEGNSEESDEENIEYNVYRMDLDGQNKEMFLQTTNGMISMDENYIIYSPDSEIVMLYDIKTGESRQISETMLYTPQFFEGNIYYVNEEQKLAKMNLADGTSEALQESTAYNIILAGNNIYYLNYKDETNGDYTVLLYKYNIYDGTVEEVIDFEYLGYINITENHVFYMDLGEEIKLSIFNNETKEDVTLQTWDREQIIANSASATTAESTEENTEVSNDTTEETSEVSNEVE